MQRGAGRQEKIVPLTAALLAGSIVDQNRTWSKRLNAAYNGREAVRNRDVRLPASGPMTVSGEGRNVTITLRPDAVVRNMQENSAAFEGWSVALKRWCDVATVTLQWEPPSDAKFGQKHGRHYQRFLYRVARFQSLFPEWFVVGPSNPFSQSMVLEADKLFLNVAGDGPDVPSTSSRAEDVLVDKI